ncbi:MAG: D-alanyl-D-alanine carboxypeptidase/D-alanyl-D-alanine endopeptidase [Saprospiraceae bacterium]
MKSSILLILCLIPVLLFSQRTAYMVESALRRMLSEEALEKALLGVSVREVSSGEEVVSYNGNKMLIPASSLKLISNFSALHLLGKDHRFKTQIYYTGSIDYSGELSGDLIVMGGADPTLGSVDFKGVAPLDKLLENLVDRIKSAGINCIEGRLILDDSIVSDAGSRDSWQWNDVANYYGAGAWGLNIHNNLFYIHFDTRDKIGKKAKLVSYNPVIDNLSIQSEVLVAGTHTGDQAYVFGGPDIYTLKIKGSLASGRKDFRIKAAIPNPGLFFMSRLKAQLEEAGITSGNIQLSSDNSNKDLKNILTLNSPSLERIVYMSNLESNNLYTEALLWALATDRSRNGKYEQGIKRIEDMLKRLDLSVSEYRAVDACGLSRQNYISSSLMTGFLKEMIALQGESQILKLMAQPGDMGTAENLFTTRKDKKSIWLKTGSMSSVQSYSGYIKSKNGKLYAYCLMANGFSAGNRQIRNIFEEFLNTL